MEYTRKETIGIVSSARQYESFTVPVIESRAEVYILGMDLQARTIIKVLGQKVASPPRIIVSP